MVGTDTDIFMHMASSFWILLSSPFIVNGLPGPMDLAVCMVIVSKRRKSMVAISTVALSVLGTNVASLVNVHRTQVKPQS